MASGRPTDRFGPPDPGLEAHGYDTVTTVTTPHQPGCPREFPRYLRSILTTDQKGNIAEQAVAWAATKLGIDVYRPLGEGSRYDLILDLGERLLRVQCKWAPRSGDVVLLRCRSCRRTREGLRSRGYTAQEIDAFAAYCPDLDTCYLVPIERAGSQGLVSLRVAEARNHQRGAIVWARDFEFAAVDWTALGAVAQLEERRRGTPEAGGSSPPSSITDECESSPVQTVGAHEFRNHFGYHLDRAAAGEELLVTRRGRPYARLSPAAPERLALGLL